MFYDGSWRYFFFEILLLIFQMLKRSRDNDLAVFQRQFVVPRLGLAMINLHTKFEVSIISRSGDILGGLIM